MFHLEIPFPAYRGEEPYFSAIYAHSDANIVYPNFVPDKLTD